MRKLIALTLFCLISSAQDAQWATGEAYRQQAVVIDSLRDSVQVIQAKWDSIEYKVKKRRNR